MGFLFPSVPKPQPSANAPTNPTPPKSLVNDGAASGFSPFSASPAGLRRKDSMNKTSLIGGG